MPSKIRHALIALSLGLFFTTNTYARIKLITLPVREHVEIQLENENTTIIEEERIVPLRKGTNEIDFSWHNTSIKPDTIVFRVLPSDDANASLKANVLSVSYPPNESALTWTVSASAHGSARVRITYAIERLDRSYHYIARANTDETLMDLQQYVKVNNQSGEAFLNADINTGSGRAIRLPMGLDESQEFLNQQFKAIPIDKTYTVNAATLGYRDRAQDKLKVLMHYNIHNDAKHNLGQQSLAAGKVRIYQRDSNGTRVFIGEDWGKFIAREDSGQLFVGEARDIVVKRTIESKKRQRINGNLYNINAIVKYEIENFKDKPLNLIIEESIPLLRDEVFSSRRPRMAVQVIEWQIGKQNSFSSEPLKKQSDSQTIAYQVTLPARTGQSKVLKLEKKLHILIKNEW
ncbi:DUF4139 domain-containing protein [sulfur-oxidizing endosymbiont of Gigantopelta aegis]|uniref:DUF4139 domain-containing protein n=1 Tax=sulfur-oxidizing endosymbiont of Gigantopelta aegis TaxID=2794934 RepID=UPI0018DCBD50|nr:DUF4139 domain-containing protein [sulfur-oxidizing endosymbiont of Gigantopelta aegis]